MCQILDGVVEIFSQCEEKNIEIDYLKLQKLAYICQCVHYEKHNVPLFPDKIYNWSFGGGFKRLYTYFNGNEVNLFEPLNNNIMCQVYCCNKKIKMLPNKKFLRNGNEIIRDYKLDIDVLFFEKRTIDYVIENYASLSFDELKDIVLSDPIYNELETGELIQLEKLTNKFVIEEIKEKTKKKELR